MLSKLLNLVKGSPSVTNPFAAQTQRVLKSVSSQPEFFSLPGLEDKRVETLPYSIRVLLECAIRNCDDFTFKQADVEKILDWQNTSQKETEIPFKPARVLLQDFTGVPALVDLAAMRDAMQRLGGDPSKINPLCPVDLVIDHSVQVDLARTKEARAHNERLEFERNKERFEFLKWGQSALKNVRIVPPGSGIVHQVNLEYLARVAFRNEENNLIYPDSLVGTDSHTTMINGLGVTGWGVGGIEAEAVMLGQPISMVLPQVVGFRLTGKLPAHATATDVVLTVTQMLRKRNVVGKFVEFFGPGCQTLGLADRATIANMAPEYGATMGYFPVDEQTAEYLRLTGRDAERTKMIVDYLTEQGLFRTYDGSQADPVYSGEVMELDLASVEPSLAGPKRPHDRVSVQKLKSEFDESLTQEVSFKGFGLQNNQAEAKFNFTDGAGNTTSHILNHGSVLIAAITSCTNTSNPDVMLAAGLLAKNAVEKGLDVAPYIKTSLSPGSGVVQKYYERSGVLPFLEKLGFHVTGYGCMTCIGNSGDLDPEVTKAVQDNDIVAAGVLSGNRNFEGRVHPLTRANYLASPPLVVAYALAGRVNIDFDTEPIGKAKDGSDVFLKQIWPTREEVQKLVNETLKPEMFKEVYEAITTGNQRWNELKVKEGKNYEWDPKSTYIHNPPFFAEMEHQIPFGPTPNVEKARCLALFGDSITTDHISPAGNIAKNSPAAHYLRERGVEPKDFNSYGSRRGNDEIMARGTFANVRLINQMASKVGPFAKHVPSGWEASVFEVAQKYGRDSTPLIIMAGNEYGSGSSRDWAAKGPYLQGVKIVIAQSFERIHRTNLVGMGILPLQFKEGESPKSLGLNGDEEFDFDLSDLKVGGIVKVKAQDSHRKVEFELKTRLDTEPELAYYRNGGILHYVLRNLASDDKPKS